MTVPYSGFQTLAAHALTLCLLLELSIVRFPLSRKDDNGFIDLSSVLVNFWLLY